MAEKGVEEQVLAMERLRNKRTVQDYFSPTSLILHGTHFPIIHFYPILIFIVFYAFNTSSVTPVFPIPALYTSNPDIAISNIQSVSHRNPIF